MLSKVAESLYWMARNIERAEDLTRLIAVNFHAMLDMASLDTAQGWAPLIAMNGDEALFYEIYGQPTPQAVIEFVLWHPLNPNAVTACITHARENARSVREQISSEMWEQINRLYFWLKDVDRTAVINSPHDFFQQIRNGSQMFQGVTLATMTHSEQFEFIWLGTHLERADKTVRILSAQYTALSRALDSSAETALQLIALLRSCSAFEPFRRAPGLNLQIDQVVHYLLLNREFPRSVLFCVNRSLQSLDLLGHPSDQLKADHPRRSLGRLGADLEYVDLSPILNQRLNGFLDELLQRLNIIGGDVARTYFDTRVILPDDRPRQQQQQQQ
jgi:uncharacterized alpha-E superfamily protein